MYKQSNIRTDSADVVAIYTKYLDASLFWPSHVNIEQLPLLFQLAMFHKDLI